jgi:DNA polymerase
MPYSGQGKKGILIVGEAPGADDDKANKQFAGVNGQYLSKVLKQLGVDMRRDCWLHNALICRPPKDKVTDNEMVDYCRPNVVKAIKELQPKVIIPMGQLACESIIAWLWKGIEGDIGSISRWLGFRIPAQKINAWVCPNWHPNYVCRSNYGSGKKNEVVEMYFKHYLEGALEKDSHPWDEVPDYKSKIIKIHDTDEAAKAIRWIIRKGGVTAFDYETNMLKPEGPGAYIRTCSICWEGKRTIAFPWSGEAIKAMQEYLVSPLPKIASNMKFEDRWSRRIAGAEVVNWFWDTMNVAHVQDNRRDITGLKFQGFVWLGYGEYNSHLEEFLKAKSSITPNRIHEIDLDDLLTYNGIDSLLEYEVAMRQIKVCGFNPYGE